MSMALEIISAEEFAKFESKNRYGNFFQSVERAELRETMEFSSYLLGLKKEGKLVAVGLLVEKNREAWIQNGPILDWDDKKLTREFVKGVVEFAKSKKFLRLEIYPPVLLSVRDTDGNKIEEYNRKGLFKIFEEIGFHHKGMTTKMDFKSLRWVFVKNLGEAKTLEEAIATFGKSTRNKWRKTQKELDIYVLQDKKELKEWIKPLRESNERNNAKTRSVKYFEDMWDLFGEKVRFIEARRKDTGEIVASQVEVWHKNELASFLSGVTEKYKKYNGMTAIKGYQIQECIENGQKRLNLYGIEGDFSDNNPLLMTKKSYGGVVEEYVGGFLMTLKPVGYFLMRVKRKLGF